MEEFLSMMDPYIVLWLVLMIIFIVVELITVGLTCIWFAAGSLLALLLAVAGAGFPVQIIVFFAVSFLLLFFTRPWAQKYINGRTQRTNSESLIGETIRISERVSNIDQTGAAVVNGQEWTVRTAADHVVLEKGSLAKIVQIQGVKLIVEQCNCELTEQI